MRRLGMCLGLAASLWAAACGSGAKYPALAIGAAAPAFSLPATDGQTYDLSAFASAKVLAVVFTCNHCPEAQAYESRIQALHRDFKDKGVAVVAINPNNGDRQAPSTLAYTDMPDTLEGMKIRVDHRALEYPYLYDGDAQAAAKAYGVEALPQVFVFDRARTLRYRGRIDDNRMEAGVRTRAARAAIESLLADRSVARTTTDVSGCEPEWLDASAAKPAAPTPPPTPVVTMVGVKELQGLRRNGSDKLLMVNFWATWCGPCVSEFPDLEATYAMYRSRGFDFVAVSVNDPSEKPMVEAFLTKNGAGVHRNLQFGTPDAYGLQTAFDPNTPASVPFTVVIAPNGDVLYQELGASDIPKLRRAILAGLPEDPKLPGARAYWTAQ